MFRLIFTHTILNIDIFIVDTCYIETMSLYINGRLLIQYRILILNSRDFQLFNGKFSTTSCHKGNILVDEI